MEHYQDFSSVAEDRVHARKQVVGQVPVSDELKKGEMIARDLDPDPRGVMYGFNYSKDRSRKYPRLTHADLDAMMEGTSEVHYTELCSILSQLFRPGSEEWREYLAIRVAQRRKMENGLGEYSVVRNVFPPFVPSAVQTRLEGTKVKKYELIQFFKDSFVRDKYGLSSKFITSVQLLAISDPNSAAQTLQDKVQNLSPGVEIRVSAGRYSESKAQCQRILKKAAASVRDLQGASTAMVSGKVMFIYAPNSTDLESWHVYGPIAYAESIYDVYRLVLKAGMREVAVLYAFELVKLGIYVHDGKEVVASTFIGNVGNADTLDFVPLRYSMVFGSVVSDVKAKLDNCLSIVSEGVSIATAVRVSDTTIVANAHVVESADCYVLGQKLTGGTPIGQDLWAYTLLGSVSPWKVREPKVGEKAVMLAYSKGAVNVSPDFRIDKVDGLNVYSNRLLEVTAGASGAAVVSLDDGALLGIHSGLSGRYMLAVTLSPSVLMDLREWEDSCKKGEFLRETLSDQVIQELSKRGARSSFMSVLQNLLPLFDKSGVHVGTALNMDCKLTTTLPPGDYLVGKSKRVVTFESYIGQYSVSYDSESTTDLNPAITRIPDTFENVVLVGVDSSSSFVSRVTTVKQVASGKRTFMLGSTEGNIFPLSGAVVVSMQDAAVLGTFVRDSSSVDVGRLSLCASVVRDVPSALRDDLSALADKFPLLGVRAWPDGVVSEVLTHSSVQSSKSNLDLARVGDAAIRAALHMQLREQGFSGSSQELVVKHQSNSYLAEVAWSYGLAQLIKKQSGISFAASSKAYADVVEAFLGAIYIYSNDKFMSVCHSLGVIPRPGDVSPRLLRRTSSFSGLHVPFGSVQADTEVLVTPVD